MQKNLQHIFFTFLFTIFLVGSGFVGFAQRKITDNPENYKEKGVASYYGIHFDGQLTASGEVFNSKGLTAASNTLPLHTYVKVTNLKNGKWVVVRINDRMSKHNRRLIDLTHKAAKQLGFLRSGLTKVLVEYIPEEFYSFFGLSPETLLLISGRI